MPAYGRGGAGNIQAIEQEKVRIAADIEANHGPTGFHTNESIPLEYTRHEGQTYAHMGRGGMGNYYSPKESNRSGEVKDSRTLKDRGVVEDSNQAAKTYGRGGAGNYAVSLSINEERAARERQAEERTREKLRQDVENGVQQHLALPPKAKLAGG